MYKQINQYSAFNRSLNHIDNPKRTSDPVANHLQIVNGNAKF